MSSDPESPNSASSAQEFMQATISVEHLAGVTEQSEVSKLVENLPGVESLSIVEGKLHICYDPLRVSEKEIEAAISRGGHPVLGGEAERSSPFAED